MAQNKLPSDCIRVVYDWTHAGFMSTNLVYLALSERQIEPIFEHFTAAVTRYMVPAPPADIESARAMVGDVIEAHRHGNHLTLAIFGRAAGEFLGCVAINGMLSATPELGIWFKAAAQGHGYGTEALGSLMAWYQKRFAPRYYVYPVDIRNIASYKLAQHFGGREQRRYAEQNGAGETLQVAELHIPPVIVR